MAWIMYNIETGQVKSMHDDHPTWRDGAPYAAMSAPDGFNLWPPKIVANFEIREATQEEIDSWVPPPHENPVIEGDE